ncbi:histidine kinase dimerization/phosphoacceptor domain -containing protein [Methanothermobacter sp. K4]|uniref:histidine kinase dimerization/phosphoacceptor domain -containing protein n=1 Tax=Methanothermobacter sp. K4 TaxID=2913262 RepID=UPI001EDB5693|nr:histidine kinase dimerization/phosphoacceptor domain -containing protein [Methanothermobacter sp. K4]MCG2828368.1 ATP-binding protein [Methanothermobacter sp. K4]
MNIYSTLSVLAFVSYLIMGFYPLKRSRGNLEWSFLLIALSMAWWALTLSIFYMASSVEQALLMYILSGVARILMPALFLNFALVLSAGDKKINKAASLVTLIPAFLFIYLLLKTALITPVIVPDGGLWNIQLEENGIWWLLFEIYLVGYFAAAVSIIWNHARTAPSQRERKMSTIIFMASSLSLIACWVVNSLLPSIGVHSIQAISHIIALLATGGMAYALLHYPPITINPSLAGESIIDKVTDLVVLLDSHGRVIRLNYRAIKELGVEYADDWRSLVAPEHHDILEEEFEFIRQNAGGKGDYHHRPVQIDYITSGGRRIPVKLFISLIREDADSIGYSLVAQDLRHTLRLRDRIEESKESERLTRMRLHEFRVINEAITLINHSESPEELFRNVFSLTHEHLSLKEGQAYIMEDGKPVPAEGNGHEFQDTDLTGILEGLSLENVFVDGGVIVAAMRHGDDLLGFFVFRNGHEPDEYELKLLETIGAEAASTLKRIFYQEKLLKSLEEKELLLREIHHRVKNNLQVVSSLLNLQSSYIKDPQIVSTLKDSQGRVMSMSMIHEKLYRSENLSDIDVRGYIEGLVRSIMFSYQKPDQSVDVRFDVDRVKLNIDTIMPLGLIVNELVTNAFKYAFPNGDGELLVSLKRRGDRFVLRVADNGVGLPPDFSFENLRSLGMLLVRNLTGQLDGTLEYTSGSGTEFRIEFSEIRYRERF